MRKKSILNGALKKPPNLNEDWKLLCGLPPHKIFLWDDQGTYVDCEFPNPHYGHFLGGEALLGGRLQDVLSQKGASLMLSAIHQACQAHEPRAVRLSISSQHLTFQSLVRLFPVQQGAIGWVNDFPVQSRTWQRNGTPVKGQGHSPIHLTLREQEVVQWVFCGKSNAEVARILTISERTLQFHLDNLYVKLQISSREQLISIVPSLVTEPFFLNGVGR